MAQCPLCSAEITADFGLVDCPGCGAMLAIGMDGSVQAEGDDSGISSTVEHGEPPALESHSVVEDVYSEPAEVYSEPNPIQESGSDFLMEPDGEDAPEPEFMSDPQAEVGDENLEAAPPAFDEEHEDQLVVEESETIEPPPLSSADLSDISSFANSEVSQGREGLLRLNLTLSCIDTKETREELHEVLNDQRFLWDADSLLAQIKNGELVIADVSPVKAYLVISQIRHLPIEISWEQYAIHQA